MPLLLPLPLSLPLTVSYLEVADEAHETGEEHSEAKRNVEVIVTFALPPHGNLLNLLGILQGNGASL